MKDHTITHAAPGSSTIEPSGATDDIRYVLNRDAQPASPATLLSAEGAADQQSEAAAAQPAGAGGLADTVIDNADEQLPDQTESTIRGGKVGQESKRGAY